MPVPPAGHSGSTVNFQMKSALLIIQIIQVESKINNDNKRNSDSKRITDYFVIMMLPLNSTHFRPNCGRHGFNTYFSKSNLQKQQMVAIALASPETAWQHRNSVPIVARRGLARVRARAGLRITVTFTWSGTGSRRPGPALRALRDVAALHSGFVA